MGGWKPLLRVPKFAKIELSDSLNRIVGDQPCSITTTDYRDNPGDASPLL
jgi:hypothetical protein